MLVLSVVRMAFKAERWVFGNRRKTKNSTEHCGQVLRCKKCRRSTAQMDFLYDRFFGEQFHIEFPFLLKGFEIGRLYVVVFCDPFIASTKGAQSFTKRQVQIQADTFSCIAFGKAIYNICCPVL